MLDDPVLNRRPEEKMFDLAFDVSVSCGGSTAEGSAERGESSDKQSSGSELEGREILMEEETMRTLSFRSIVFSVFHFIEQFESKSLKEQRFTSSEVSVLTAGGSFSRG